VYPSITILFLIENHLLNVTVQFPVQKFYNCGLHKLHFVGTGSSLIRLHFIHYYCWATGWAIGVLGFDSRRGLGIFLFTNASRTALGPTQPPIQWVPGALSLGVKRPRREADHSSPSSAEVKEWVEQYLHSPNRPSWRCAQLKKVVVVVVVVVIIIIIIIWSPEKVMY
jgi:hypothetical protein